ncbi:MAG: hypothetical protein ILP12_03830 [Lachnospiraceae bacterium]|nr:hypothetical protein [Lachnospiraceae bacterium]
MQSVYLPLHIVFIIRLIIKRQPTPIWRWFTVVVIGLLVMISGRLLESIAYMYFPVNGFYVFAVYYQLVGTSFATSAYLIWNLYLAGHDRFSESRTFKALLLAMAGIVSLIICTNNAHHLFYEKLTMGEQVVHGKLFLPCLLVVYGTLFIGWIVSVVHIIRSGKDKVKRLIVFSLYPILPAAASLIRSISGVDKLDYMPIIMTVSIFCLYLMVFRYRYVDIVSQSIETALRETRSALFVYDPERDEVTYTNRGAEEEFGGVISSILPKLKEAPDSFEATSYGKNVLVTVTPTGEQGFLLVTATDISDMVTERSMLEEEIARQNSLVAELEEKERNIDAYLDTLYEIPDLREKQERIAAAQQEVSAAFGEIEENLTAAGKGGAAAETLLRENLRIARRTIASVRAAVSALREGS